MPVIPVVHRSRAARAALRRGLPRRGIRVMSCRALRGVETLLQREVVDAVVLELRPGVADAALQLAARYPRIPLFALTPFRPHDGGLMLACRRAGMRVLQAGVDDPVAGELVATRTATLRRRAALRDAPALLRLTEPLQLHAWDEVLLRVGTRTQTGDIAEQLGFTREHLSREFAAGGAPNLKRVIDLARILCAGDLLGNPGYDIPTVGRILRFASPSHFAASARRIAGASPRELPRLGLRQILARFLRGRMRSRL